MKITNTSSKLLIAKNPSAPLDADRQYLEINFLTNLVYNYSSNKQESKYYKNLGTTTQTITGQSYSISASIDIDLSEEAHIFLIDLARKRDIFLMNNNWLKIFEPLFPEEQEAGYSFGKCVLEFKNNFPSGPIDEIVKLEFDIFPQDDIWEYVPAVPKKDLEIDTSIPEKDSKVDTSIPEKDSEVDTSIPEKDPEISNNSKLKFKKKNIDQNE